LLSTSAEAKTGTIDRLTVNFDQDDATDESMTLAFAKPMADARKEVAREAHGQGPPGCSIQQRPGRSASQTLSTGTSPTLAPRTFTESIAPDGMV
jgi:hypothetical protein